MSKGTAITFKDVDKLDRIQYEIERTVEILQRITFNLSDTLESLDNLKEDADMGMIMIYLHEVKGSGIDARIITDYIIKLSNESKALKSLSGRLQEQFRKGGAENEQT